MFRPVPKADYVYCADFVAALPLASTDFVRFCHSVWEVVYSAGTWGEFADRLTALHPEFAEYLFPDGPEMFFSEDTSGFERGDPFEGSTSVEFAFGGAFPFGGGGDWEPYVWWSAYMPEEIVDLCDGGDYLLLDPARLPEALAIIREHGETAVEDCELLTELAWPSTQWPPPPWAV